MTKEIYVDGACSGNPGPMRIAVVVPESYSMVEDIGHGTNNQAEYHALNHALDLARTYPEDVIIKSDSKLVVEQVNGNFKVKSQSIKLLHALAKERLENLCGHVQVIWIPREENLADSLFH